MNITYCQQCGGIIGMTYTTSGMGYMESSVSSSAMAFCGGHPAPKHDGNLDAYTRNDRHATVKIALDPVFSGAPVEISGGYGDCESNFAALDPKQALSLLAWLQQEEPMLKRLIEDGEA